MSMTLMKLDLWLATGAARLPDGGVASLDSNRLQQLQPYLADFTNQRKWATGSDRRFAQELVARVPSIAGLGVAWRGQLAHLLDDLRLTVDHDRASAAVKTASRLRLKPKVFALLDDGQPEVVNAQGGTWRLATLEEEHRLLPLEVIDGCAALDRALWSDGDEVDAWLIGHEQKPVSRKTDPVLLAGFGRWLVELARWESR